MRLILENVLLLLLPAAAYVAYRLLLSDPETKALPKILNEAPLIWLFVAGALLVAGTRIYYAATSTGGAPEQTYTPPRMGKDGKIEPAQIK